MKKIGTTFISALTLILLFGCASPEETGHQTNTETEMNITGKIIDPQTGTTNEAIPIKGSFVQKDGSMVMYIDTSNIPWNTSEIHSETLEEIEVDGVTFKRVD